MKWGAKQNHQNHIPSYIILYYDPSFLAKVPRDFDPNKNIVYRMSLLNLEGLVGM